MGNVVLQMKHITKRYPGVVALNDVSVDFEAGKVHALLGENGAGKSTLIKVLSGAVQNDEGQICIEGNDTGNVKSPWCRGNLSGIQPDWLLNSCGKYLSWK